MRAAALLLALALLTGCYMAERGGDRPNVDSLFWCDGSGFPRTEPAGSKKLAGYDPGSAGPPVVPGEVPSATDHNWLFGLAADVSRWVDGAHVRAFDDIGEAIAAVPIPDTFRVGQPTLGNRAPGQIAWSLAPAGFTAVADACTDGERSYYIDPVGIYAASVDDGSQVWTTGSANISTAAIATDGKGVYVSGNALSPGLTQIDRDTGNVNGVAGTPTGAADIAANGQYAVIAASAPIANNLYYYTTLTAPAVETGFTSHGNPVQACAIDRDSVYFGGVRGGGFDVRCHDLATRAQTWASVINTAAAPLITSIETDGTFVYVGAVRGPSPTGSANFYILNAYDGTLLTSLDLQVGAATDNITNIAHDGRALYVTLDGGTGYVIRVLLDLGGTWALPGVFITGAYPGIVVGYECDGIGLVSGNGAAATQRHFFQDSPRTFQRVGGDDPERVPFFNLAIPSR